MDLKKTEKLFNGLLIAALIFIPFCCSRQIYATWSALVVTILIGAAVTIWLLFWRCPDCGKNLGRIDNKKHCPHCGAKLYQE